MRAVLAEVHVYFNPAWLFKKSMCVPMKHGGLAMNKSDLIEAVASELESSKSEAGKVIEAVINAISDGLKTEEKVAISGFGTFTKKHRGARIGMNPATKQPIQIGESTTCSFKPSQHLKDALHKTSEQLVR